MTTQELLELASIFVSLIVGLGAGFIGSYIGTKVGVAKLETWRDILHQGLKDAQGDIRLLTDDCHTFDTEIEMLMATQKMNRARRQRFRD